MEEHKNLKEIIDNISYNLPDNIKYVKECNTFVRYLVLEWRVAEVIDVREIIFTQEFMMKLDYFLFNNELNNTDWAIDLLKNLDNPTQYLYNIIRWTK